MKKIKLRKKRLKRGFYLKKILLIVIVMILFFCSRYVKAGINDSSINKNRIEGIYAITKLNGVDRIFYFNKYQVNEVVAYCIDLGVDITSSIYNSTDDFSMSSLSKDKIEYIRKISYFGYGYEGHNDDKYYMASQELIWEYLSSIDVFWSNEMRIDGEKIDIENYKIEILELVNNSNKELSFDNGQVYMVGEQVVFNDINKVISDYEVVSTNYSDAVIKDDSLIVNVGNVIGRETIKLKKKNYYNYDSKLYYYENSQRLISNGNYTNDIDEVNFNSVGISVMVNVVNGMQLSSVEASLEGAVYEVYDSDGVLFGVYETDKDGRFVIDNLLIGEYLIKQITPSKGYSINKKDVKLNVNSDINEITLTQNIIFNSFELTKLYGSDGDYKPEALIDFLVRDINGNFVMYLVTDYNGVENFRLGYGKYKIIQNNTTKGYKKVDDFFVEVREEKDINDITYINLVNEMVKVKLQINVYDKESGDKLLNEGFSYKIKPKNAVDYLNVDENDVFSVLDNGFLNISNGLGYGIYILEQIDVPEGILLNEVDVNVEINEHSNFSLVNGDLVIEVNVFNERIKGRVEVLSKEEKYIKTVNNFEYDIVNSGNREIGLFADEDIIFNNEIIYKSGVEIQSDVTNDTGVLVFDNLYLGTYCLFNKEINEKKCINLISEDNQINLVSEKVDFLKKLDKGDLVIHNVSAIGVDIEGTLFELIDKENFVIYNGITNVDGIIKISDLLFGEYCIKQKKVGNDYVLRNEDICFEVNDNEKIEVVNDLVSKKIIKVPNTFSKDNYFYKSFIAIILIGIGVILYKKIFINW